MNSESDRATVLSALSSVDAVVLFGEETPLELIRVLRPDILAKGADYSPEQVVGREEVESWGGRLVLVPLLEGRSTTATLAKLNGGLAGLSVNSLAVIFATAGLLVAGGTNPVRTSPPGFAVVSLQVEAGPGPSACTLHPTWTGSRKGGELRLALVEDGLGKAEGPGIVFPIPWGVRRANASFLALVQDPRTPEILGAAQAQVP